MQAERAVLEPQTQAAAREGPRQSPTVRLPVPGVPQALCDAIVSGQCGLFAGAGLSAQAGYPTWRPFLEKLLDWAIAERHVDDAFGESLRAALRQGSTATVADSVVSAAPTEALLKYLEEVFATGPETIPLVHHHLKGMGFCAAFTTNFDTLLERTFGDTLSDVLTPTATDALREALTKNRFFILKLYGTLERPDSVLVAPQQFRDAVSRNRAFSNFMESVFFSRTLLFLGASLDGIQTYLDGLSIRAELAPNRYEVATARGPQRTHYALVAVTDDAWRAQADVLRRRYNIEVLPYTPDEEHTQVRAFVESVEQLVNPPLRSGDVGAPRVAPLREPSTLKSVHLENIGPFEKLDLELDRNWNVLLGDNGVGKSTILKAIGLALCGRDGQSYAGRLVRVGQSYGKIVLNTGRNSYLTDLFQGDGQVEVDAHGKPFESEGWLALGFSPIRTVTWERPKGPTAMGKSVATSEDVLPLVRGDVDPRMNNVKQWLVNLDYYRAKDEVKGGTTGRYGRLQQDFETTVKALLHPMQFDIKVKNAEDGLVMAITADGEVPIESVSQGTASLLGWIGVLIQRLYEVFDKDPTPRDQYALVMLDEIDAHMHPAWQRSLVSQLTALFPNVQFIATTHSPLIVGGMPASQLFRFSRGVSGKVEMVELEEDTAMGRSDQVLRGQLFDLPVTLDNETEKLMADYQVVLADPKPEARKRQAELERQLMPRLPRASADPAERRAQELVEAVLKEQLLPTDAVTKLVSERAKKLLAAVSRTKARGV
jgi:energy-coupling factor transporter ATP-binding protein EcfA2